MDSRKLKSFDSSACSSKSSRPTPAAPPTAAPDNRRGFSQLYSHEHLTTQQQQHQQQQKIRISRGKNLVPIASFTCKFRAHFFWTRAIQLSVC